VIGSMRGSLRHPCCRASRVAFLRPARRDARAASRRAAARDRYESHLAAGGIAPAGGALRNPHQVTGRAKSGASCLPDELRGCPGVHGGGWVGPNLADGRWRYGGADAEVSTQSTTVVQKGMPAFGGTLGAEEYGPWSLTSAHCRCRAMCPPIWSSRELSGGGHGGRWGGRLGGAAMAAGQRVGADSVNRKPPGARCPASDPYLWLEDVTGKATEG